MNRTRLQLLACALSLAMLLPAAARAYLIDIAVAPGSGAPGDTVTATVTLDDSFGVVVFDFSVAYDFSKLAVSDVRPGAGLAADWALLPVPTIGGPPLWVYDDFLLLRSLLVSDDLAGTVSTTGFSVPPTLDPGPLALVEIDFTILPGAAPGPTGLSFAGLPLLETDIGFFPLDTGPPAVLTITPGVALPEPAPLALLAFDLLLVAGRALARRG